MLCTALKNLARLNVPDAQADLPKLLRILIPEGSGLSWQARARGQCWHEERHGHRDALHGHGAGLSGGLTELLAVLGRGQAQLVAEQKAHVPHTAKTAAKGHGFQGQVAAFQQAARAVDARTL